MPQVQRQPEKKRVTTLRRPSQTTTSRGGGGGGESIVYVEKSVPSIEQTILRWTVTISIGVFLLLLLPREAQNLTIFGIKIDKLAGYTDLLTIVLCYGLLRLMTIISDALRDVEGFERLPRISFSISKKEMVELTQSKEDIRGFDGRPELFKKIWQGVDLLVERIMILVLVILLCAGFITAIVMFKTIVLEPVLPLHVHWLSLILAGLFFVGALIRGGQLLSGPILIKVAKKRHQLAQEQIAEEKKIIRRKAYITPVVDFLSDIKFWCKSEEHYSLLGLELDAKKACDDEPWAHMYLCDNLDRNIYSDSVVRPYEQLQALQDFQYKKYPGRREAKEAGDYEKLFKIHKEAFEALDLEELEASLKEPPYDNFFKTEPPSEAPTQMRHRKY